MALGAGAVVSATAPDQTGTTPRVPLDLRSASLLVIAVLLGLAALHLASAVFVPLVMGVMLSYVLAPLVDRMVRLHIPRVLAAAILMLGLVGAIGSIAYSLGDETVDLVESLPAVVHKLSRSLEAARAKGQAGPIEKVQAAASEIERAAAETSDDPEPDHDVAKVQIQKPKLNVRDYLWPGTLGVAAAVANIVIVFIIAFLLLAAGNRFRRKMTKLAGPALSKKKLTVHALDEIDRQVQRYMLVQVLTSTLVGVATWLAFLWIGVENAAVWGILTFVLNFIPYLGSIVATVAAMLVGYAQFGSLEMGLLIGGVEMVINLVEGYVLTPLLTSRAIRMNPVAVFAGVLTWGWLWGIWGLFLGVPILVVIKVVCDRVEEFKLVGEFLGE